MSLNSIKIGSAALFAVIFVGGACSKSGDGLTADQKAQIQKAQTQSEQVDDQKKEIAKLSTQVDQASQDEDTVKSLSDQEAKLNAMQAQLVAQKTSQDQYQAQMDAAAQKSAAIQAQLDAVKAKLAEKNAIIQQTVNALNQHQTPPADLLKATFSSLYSASGQSLLIADVDGVSADQENLIFKKISAIYPGVRHSETVANGVGHARYMFVSSSDKDPGKIFDLVSSFNLKVSFNRFNRVVVNSYIQFQENHARLFKSPSPFIFIGHSMMVDETPADLSQIDDVYSYTSLPSACNPEVTVDCITQLRATGYISTDKEGKNAITQQVAYSASLGNQGKFNGGFTDKSVSIQDITLKNIVYAEIVNGKDKTYIELPLNPVVSHSPALVKNNNARALYLAQIATALQAPLKDAPVETVNVNSGPVTVDPSLQDPDTGAIASEPLSSYDVPGISQ